MILIFEGIASSGKTTLIDCLASRLRERQTVSVIDEAITLLPLVGNSRIDKATGHLESVLDLVEHDTSEHVLIDRLLLTHAFRTNAKIRDFSEIEQRLRALEACIVVLCVESSAIPSRLRTVTVMRGVRWKFGKEGSFDERVVYYQRQQSRLLELQGESKLPSLIIDTTEQNWEAYVYKILGWGSVSTTRVAA